MAGKTPNYNLTKPDSEDFYDVEVQNSNMDIIDASLKGLDEGKAASADLTSLEQTVTEYLDQSASFDEYSLSLNQSIPDNSLTPLLFTDKTTHGNSSFSTFTGDTFTITESGIYQINISVAFGITNISTNRQVAVSNVSGSILTGLNGTTLSILNDGTTINLSSLNALTTDTKFKVSVRHTHGSALDVLRANSTKVKIRRIG